MRHDFPSERRSHLQSVAAEEKHLFAERSALACKRNILWYKNAVCRRFLRTDTFGINSFKIHPNLKLVAITVDKRAETPAQILAAFKRKRNRTRYNFGNIAGRNQLFFQLSRNPRGRFPHEQQFNKSAVTAFDIQTGIGNFPRNQISTAVFHLFHQQDIPGIFYFAVFFAAGGDDKFFCTLFLNGNIGVISEADRTILLPAAGNHTGIFQRNTAVGHDESQLFGGVIQPHFELGNAGISTVIVCGKNGFAKNEFIPFPGLDSSCDLYIFPVQKSIAFQLDQLFTAMKFHAKLGIDRLPRRTGFGNIRNNRFKSIRSRNGNGKHSSRILIFGGIKSQSLFCRNGKIIPVNSRSAPHITFPGMVDDPVIPMVDVDLINFFPLNRIAWKAVKIPVTRHKTVFTPNSGG